MNSNKNFENPLPEEKAGLFSKIFFVWLLPFFNVGYNNDLQTEDLYNCAKNDKSGILGDKLESNWEKEVERSLKNSTRSNFSRVLCSTFLKSYLINGIVICIQCVVLKMYLPIALAQYISYYEENYQKTSSTQGWLLGTTIILVSFLTLLIIHQCDLYSQRIGMKCRIATCSLIYRKLLKLNKTSLGPVAVGKLVNLLSNDVHRFDTASIYLHYIWIMPLQTAVALWVMFQKVQWATLPGFTAIILLAVLLQAFLAKLQGKFRMNISQKTDCRIRFMNDIINGIRTIKMHAWEKAFEKVVALARKHEIEKITKSLYISGIQMALMVVAGRTATYLTLMTYIFLGFTITADRVFAVVQLFNTVQMHICIFFPLGLTLLTEAKISIKRVEEFLSLEENKHQDQNSLSEEIKNGAIILDKVSTRWIPNQIFNTIQNVSLNIKPGTLCCIVGPVGSGKTSLLHLLLKELPEFSGSVKISGTISYASQEPWLFVSSIRSNILFGLPYIKTRYKKIIKICALEKDLNRFLYRDNTLIGERGVSLSGGQKARVNLARAVYRNADIYLFDDPLSAVDVHVGRHIFDECILRFLTGKTRILVTHQIQFLKQADLIIVLNNGQVEKIGTFTDISEVELKELDLNEAQSEKETRQTEKMGSMISINSAISRDDVESEPNETQELMEQGIISSSIYWKYFRAGCSIPGLLLLTIVFVVAQCCCNASDLWLTYWTNLLQIRSNTSTITNNSDLTTSSQTTNSTVVTVTLAPNQALSQDWYIEIYSILILLSIALISSRSIFFFRICMNASIFLHNIVFSNMLRATLNFFDTNPSGRILNRFTKDMGIMDELLPKSILEAVQSLLVMVGILIMVLVVTPWMIAIVPILLILLSIVRVIYLKTVQDIKRLEGITRSPVFSHVSASFYGLTTIRCSNAQNMIIREFDNLQDRHTSSWFLFIASNECFGLYVDIINSIFLTIVIYQFLIFDDGTTKSGYVGLLVTQSLIFTGLLQYGLRKTTEVDSNMTSVERILQYSKLNLEEPIETLSNRKLSRNWPQNGHIVFKDVFLRYNVEDHPVLKNLNFEIYPGEKVGIVGSTGAGKSSIISALLRLYCVEGTIEIDDVDIRCISLEDLRSHISIIPQDPVLFSNTIRYNLDPFLHYNDELLWQALDNVELKEFIDALEQQVHEGGSNFSAGQRQLICLARTILKNNKILVLDEATANIDPATDTVIQNAIRRSFKNTTVLTIAHRLNTIIDCDKILVMDAGEVVEFGPTHLLLENEKGHFTKMLKKTGSVTTKQLRLIAKAHFEKKKKKQ